MSDDFRMRARKIPKGNLFEDFELGQVFQHHWGRTLSADDNTLFSTLTMSYNPLYFNAPYARAHGHRQTVVNPMLVFLTVFGLSVEDLSEAGGLFLGVDDLIFPSARLSRQHTDRAQHRGGQARVGEPARARNRDVAYGGVPV